MAANDGPQCNKMEEYASEGFSKVHMQTRIRIHLNISSMKKAQSKYFYYIDLMTGRFRSDKHVSPCASVADWR